MYPQIRQLDTIRREALSTQTTVAPARLPRLRFRLRLFSLRAQPAPCRSC